MAFDLVGLDNKEIEKDSETASSGDEFKKVEDFSDGTFNHWLILDLKKVDGKRIVIMYNYFLS